MQIILSWTIIFAVLFSEGASAIVCKLTVTRVACSEETKKKAYFKCDGNETCDAFKRAENEKECQEMAEKECINSKAREKITKSKSVTATFGNAPLNDGKDMCAGMPEEKKNFNKCNN